MKIKVGIQVSKVRVRPGLKLVLEHVVFVLIFSFSNCSVLLSIAKHL